MTVNSAFKFLKIPKDAPLSEASASYRRLLKEYHPDRNTERSEWSHQMTIQLTEAFTAVSVHLQQASIAVADEESEIGDDEPDAGYSLGMQTRLGGLYDILLNQLHNYYINGMNNLYLRTEGTLFHQYKATLRRLQQTVETLKLTQQWAGSFFQHRQLKTIYDFAVAFYENMLIKPKEQEVPAGNDLRAQKLYQAGALALDTAIQRGVLQLENANGLICPGARDQAKKNFMLLLSNHPDSSYFTETLIKLYLLQSLARLCEHLEASL